MAKHFDGAVDLRPLGPVSGAMSAQTPMQEAEEPFFRAYKLAGVLAYAKNDVKCCG